MRHPPLKTASKRAEITFQGRPLIVEFRPDLTVTVRVLRRRNCAKTFNLADLYAESGYLDGRAGATGKKYERRGKEIVFVDGRRLRPGRTA